MRDLVTHVSTGLILDLAADNYGHPEGVEIIRSLYGNMSRSEPSLVCAEHASPIYLQMRPTHIGSDERQMWGVHFDGSQCARPGSRMSDEHKRQTEYVVRAADDAGFDTDTEVTLPTRVRPDAVAYGKSAVAMEIQRSHLTKSAAVGRTTKAVRGGMATSVWFSDSSRNRPPSWFWAVPSLAMNKLPWDVVPPRRGVTATTGIRSIEAKRCKFPDYDRCPKTRGRPCGQWHADNVPWLGMTVDDVVERLPDGDITPLRYLGKQIILVSGESKALYEQLTGAPTQMRYVDSPRKSAGTEVGRAGRVECVSPIGEAEPESFMVNPPQGSPPIVIGTTWAARNLGHYPGRCRGCGWHIKKQGHSPECPVPAAFR